MVDDGHRLCERCRAYQREYQRRYRGPARVSLRTKARAWLATAPRTPAQIAELLGISRAHARALLYQLRREAA